MSNLFWIALSKVNKMGPKTLKKLYDYNPSLEYSDFFRDNNLLNIINNEKILENIQDKELFNLKMVEARQLVELHLEKCIQVVPINSSNYPELLRYIDNPPPILYCKGNIELLKETNCIAVIGTREPTMLGIAAAKKIARKFSYKGYTIVSGLALGIDTAGHEGALEVASGKTIAILAGSLNTVYPAANKKLAKEIIERDGLLISEIPIGQKTFRGSFVARDRLQSGMSLGVCPVQASLKSGTNHTIKFAQEQDRLVFCPIPLEPKTVEATLSIYKLLESKKAEVIASPEDYSKIEKKLQNKKAELFKNREIKVSHQKSEIGNNEDFNLFNYPLD